MRVRLGAVEFLNTRPLIAALEQESGGDFELRYAVPSACARDLHAGRTDVGLIPSIEYVRSPEPYYIVPDIAISTRGEVLTVRLFLRRTITEVRRVALDVSSRTSIALLRILLREKYGLDPEMVEMAPDLPGMLAEADAALLIGDMVFQVLEAGYQSVDLGREWVELTGLPFVFAFWAGRQDAIVAEQVERLVQARREGELQLAGIARQFFEECGGSVEVYERYLSRHIYFGLGVEEQTGLNEFFRLAHKYELIETVPELRFYETPKA